MFLQVNGLKFRYKNSDRDTISDFSMNIEKGELVCIFGESGSGKSTVLRLLAGLEVPASGTIKIDEKIMVDKKTFVMPEKRGIGMVFQDYALFPHMTVANNIKFGLKNKETKERKVDEMLELVNMEGYHKRYPYELSGGQQQRIAIARALAPEPSVLLLDEPFSNLDAHLRSKIRLELNNILKHAKITSLFVTHDIEDAKAIADKIIILKEGCKIREGNIDEIVI